MAQTHNIHGTAIQLGTTGLLIRGPSGAGKSLLALVLIERHLSRGLPAALIADDRVDLTITDNTITMTAPPILAGLIELRGRGIVHRPYISDAPLHLVLDLVDELVRMPEDDAFTTTLFGIALARAPIPQATITGVEHQIMLAHEAIGALGSKRGNS